MIGNRRLLSGFIVRDLKARYVGSAMGFFWSVAFPIINLIVYMFVFRYIMNARFGADMQDTNVAIWMLAGITIWSAFAETLSRSTNSLVENSNLIQKTVFPSELLPLYLTISSMINMCIGLAIVLVGVVWFIIAGPPEVEVASLLQEVPPPGEVRQHALGLSLLCVPLLFFLQGVFTTGLGYLLSALNLFLRDIYHLIGVGTTVWMFTTPIFYPPSMVEEGADGKFAWILDINPMHWLIESYRAVLLYGEWPDAYLLGRFALVAVVIFLLGGKFFMTQKRSFPDLL